MSDIDDAEMGDPLLSSSGKLGGGEAADSAVRPLIGGEFLGLSFSFSLQSLTCVLLCHQLSSLLLEP